MPTRLDPRTKKWFFRFNRKGQYYFGGGHRTLVQAKEAERQARDQAAQIELYPEHAVRDLSFREAGNEFLENSKKHKRTWSNDVWHVAILTQFFKDKTIRAITAQNVEACLDWIKSERGVSDVTLNHYLALTKSLFNWLRKTKKYRGDNPACDVPMKQVPRGRVRFLYPAEEKILTPALLHDVVLWPYYVVGLLSGMRLGEIMRLRVADVSIAARHLFIAHSKTGRSRHVPMSESLARFLEPLVDSKKPDDPVLPNVSRCYISHRFKKVCAKADIKDLHFHDLRHTFAERSLSKGVPIYKVGKILGHASVVTTETHYGHLSMQDLKEVVDKVEGTVSSGVPNASIGSCSRIAAEARAQNA